MNSILIDELDKETQQQSKVTINGQEIEGWHVAKPLNYERKYLKLKDRLKMAIKVLKGNAIGVQYFTDLTKDEQIKYVNNKINKNGK